MTNRTGAHLASMKNKYDKEIQLKEQTVKMETLRNIAHSNIVFPVRSPAVDVKLH